MWAGMAIAPLTVILGAVAVAWRQMKGGGAKILRKIASELHENDGHSTKDGVVKAVGQNEEIKTSLDLLKVEISSIKRMTEGFRSDMEHTRDDVNVALREIRSGEHGERGHRKG